MKIKVSWGEGRVLYPSHLLSPVGTKSLRVLCPGITKSLIPSVILGMRKYR